MEDQTEGRVVMDNIIEGKIVHYVLHEGSSKGQHRPAIIVNAWGGNYDGGRVNLQVFTDFLNDGAGFETGAYWATSIRYSGDNELGTWHWIEKA
jgi:hypothetical protein